MSVIYNFAFNQGLEYSEDGRGGAVLVDKLALKFNLNQIVGYHRHPPQLSLSKGARRCRPILAEPNVEKKYSG